VRKTVAGVFKSIGPDWVEMVIPALATALQGVSSAQSQKKEAEIML